MASVLQRAADAVAPTTPPSLGAAAGARAGSGGGGGVVGGGQHSALIATAVHMASVALPLLAFLLPRDAAALVPRAVAAAARLEGARMAAGGGQLFEVSVLLCGWLKFLHHAATCI